MTCTTRFQPEKSSRGDAVEPGISTGAIDVEIPDSFAGLGFRDDQNKCRVK